MRLLLGLAFMLAFSGCSSPESLAARISPVPCKDSFALTDYRRVWLFAYDAQAKTLQPSSSFEFDSVRQANYLCNSRTLAVSYSFRGESQTDAGIDLIGESSAMVLSLVREGVNQFIPFERDILIHTSLMQRSDLDPRLGYVAPAEHAVQHEVPPQVGRGKEGLKGEHIHSELLTANPRTATVTGRIRFPAATRYWPEAEHLVVYTSALMTIDIKTGVRRRIYDFSAAPDFPHGDARLHYHAGKFVAVTGEGVQNQGVTSFRRNTVYALNVEANRWEAVASLPFKPVLVFGAGRRVLVFGIGQAAEFDMDSHALSMKEVDFGSQVPTAATEIGSGIVVVLSMPVRKGSSSYRGGEIVLYERSLDGVQARYPMPDMGLPNLTSDSAPFPAGPSFNSL